MIGTILDKYEVLQKVGEGGMATVYRGRHTTLGRDVAIKVLHPHLSSSTRNRKRFAREARAIEHLRHDNILEIFDYSGEDAEDCYIVTEFVGGQTLNAFMDEHGKLPSEIACIIGIALAQALTYAHDSAVLHRDLKPDNVMIRYDGTVKLMDFGIARFLDESQVTMTGALVGSPAFMSPEQAREAELDLRSDLFSLGTLLFFLASGHLPFAGSNPSLILKNIIEGNRPQLSELAPSASPTLADVIERLLETDRAGRFNDAREVMQQLQVALAEVRIDPDEPRWSLCAWLEEPEVYARRLDDHLRTVLLDEGRAQLEAGESLAALRLLNRLLAIDEDNAEVLALVQGLHQEPRRGRAAPWVLAGVAVFLAATAFGVFGIVTGAIPLPGSTPTVEPTPPPPPEGGDPVVIDVEEPGTAAPTTPPPTEPARNPVQPPDAAAITPIRPKNPIVRTPAGSGVGVVPSGPVAEPEDSDAGTADAEPPQMGKLRIVLPQGWGNVYINGKPTGWATYEAKPLEVEPGNFRVLVQHPLADDLEFDVSIAPGEEVRKEVELSFLPLPVAVPREWHRRCEVQVGGIDMGQLEEVDYALLAPRDPDRELPIKLDCPNKAPITHTITKAMMELGQVTLPEPG